MDPKETKKVKKIEPINFVYIGILLLFFAIITIIFFYSTNFVVKNVNKIFLSDNERGVQALDISRYALVEKKLNLPINIATEENITANTKVPEQPKDGEIVSPEDGLKIEEVIETTANKESILVNILNGARKAGVAGAMSKSIEDAGFTNITTGDSKIIYPLTTIFIKEKVKDFKDPIEEVVKKSYPKATTKTNPENSKFDVIIIVGKQ